MRRKYRIPAFLHALTFLSAGGAGISIFLFCCSGRLFRCIVKRACLSRRPERQAYLLRPLNLQYGWCPDGIFFSFCGQGAAAGGSGTGAGDDLTGGESGAGRLFYLPEAWRGCSFTGCFRAAGTGLLHQRAVTVTVFPSMAKRRPLVSSSTFSTFCRLVFLPACR